MTPTLNVITNGSSPKEEPSKEEEAMEHNSAQDALPIDVEKFGEAWEEYAETRREQVGEYHLLKQKYELNNHTVVIHLSNPVEEPLLQSIRPHLTEFLRKRLQNNTINISGQLKKITAQKIAYTNKEKFDQLAQKNPILNELKERLGLDPDF